MDMESGKPRWMTTVGCADTAATASSIEKGLELLAARSIFVSYRDCAVLVAGNRIYVSTSKSLWALELKTGRRLWNFVADEISGGDFVGYPGLRADNQHLYVVTHKSSMMRPDETLRALDLDTGQEKWSQNLSGHLFVSMIGDGVVHVDGDRVHALDAATGRALWSFKGTRVSSRLTSEGRIFLTSPTVTYTGTNRVDQGYLYAIDAKTGKLDP
jgi:outer membrane protein assembly factor BamB